MSKIQRVALISLLAIFLHQAGLIEAICGHCYGSHACIDENTAQLCFDGVANASYTVTCPANKPICTALGDMCMANITGVTPACGDTSKCSQCGDGQLFTCTSRTSFAYCSNGAVSGSGVSCPANNYCQITAAAQGNPCTQICEPDSSETCDRESDDSNDDSTTTTSTASPGNETTTATSTTSTTPATPTDASTFCQQQQTAGRFAIPNDTVCTSFIHCSYKSTWQGSVVNCPTTKPYFVATNGVCGTVQATRAGCLL